MVLLIAINVICTLVFTNLHFLHWQRRENLYEQYTDLNLIEVLRKTYICPSFVNTQTRQVQ